MHQSHRGEGYDKFLYAREWCWQLCPRPKAHEISVLLMTIILSKGPEKVTKRVQIV